MDAQNSVAPVPTPVEEPHGGQEHDTTADHNDAPPPDTQPTAPTPKKKKDKTKKPKGTKTSTKVGEEQRPTKKRRRSAESAPTVRRDTDQDTYFDVPYDEEVWYDAEEGDWDAYDGYAEAEEDTYPYAMWHLIYDDIKLEEAPEIIQETCLRLQEHQLVQPWQLKQAPKLLLEKIFPTGEYTRHLMTVLHVQEVLQRRAATELDQEGPLAKAVAKMAKTTSKVHKARDRKTDDDETASDSDAERVVFNFSKAMGIYHLGNVPQGHTPTVQKVEPMAKRAMAGQKRRGKYMIPRKLTDFTPRWMKSDLPSRVEDLPTHAHWVAAYWSRGLAQLATQGHTGKQTVSMEQLLTHFLNVSKTCIERTGKLGWHTDNEMWTAAVEATRRMDPDFDLKTHFKQVTPADVEEGQSALDDAYTPTAKKKYGKAVGSLAQKTAPAVWQDSWRSKGKYKGYKSTYTYSGKGDKGKRARMPWNTIPRPHGKGKGGAKTKYGKGKSERPRTDQAQQ